MAVRKVFSDNDEKMEITSHVIDGKLSIEIIEEDISVKIILDYQDAKDFILELNKIKKQLTAE